MFKTTFEALYQRAADGLRLALNGQDLMMAEKVTSADGQPQVLFISRVGASFLFPAQAEIQVGQDVCGQAQAVDLESGAAVVLNLRDRNHRPCLSMPTA